MASQRLRGRPAVADATGYKYKGIKDENIRPHEQCEMNEDDTHEVHPTNWPPMRIGNQGGDPHISLQCVHCGAWCLTYAAHADGRMKGIRVVLPEPVAVEQPEREALLAAAGFKRRGPGRPRKQLV
jgi:hypothetical protein